MNDVNAHIRGHGSEERLLQPREISWRKNSFPENSRNLPDLISLILIVHEKFFLVALAKISMTEKLRWLRLRDCDLSSVRFAMDLCQPFGPIYYREIRLSCRILSLFLTFSLSHSRSS